MNDTSETKSPQRNIQQHFVTAAYLAGFTPDGERDSQLYVYERNTERMFRAVPDEAAKRRNYYSIPKQDGEFDDRVDEMITGLEGQAMPGLRKLLSKDHDLTNFERALLAYLIAFQEFRTPWARANFQHMELSFVEQSMHVSAKAPGYLEYALKELEENGKVDGSVSAEQLRDALENEKIKLVAKPHAGIDLMLSSSQTAGDVYTQMQWTVLHASQGSFLTSDAPVIRRDPGHREEGFFGRGLMSPTAEVWFPLSKSACLTFRHDEAKLTKFIELLATGRKKEIEAIRHDLSPITSAEVQRLVVDAVNNETILNADRFVYSPFQSDEISRRFKGESHNMRIVVSSPFKKKKKEDDATGAR